MANVKGTTIGIYRLESEISRGGMGVVYEATIASDKRYPDRNGAKVAIKMAHNDPKYEEDFRQILEDEVDILRKVRHPGVVRIYPIAIFKPEDFMARATEMDGSPWYFVMEFLYPKSLNKVNLSVFSLGWKVELIYQLALALGHVHATRHTHQDFKPENIMFRHEPKRNEGVPQPVLIDFGLGKKRDMGEKVIEARRDRAMSVLYASPERVEHMKAPRGTAFTYDFAHHDVWAFGAVAYEILNGRYIFEKYVANDMSRTQIGEVIQKKNPLPMNDDIPQKLSNLIFAMLDATAEYRPRMAQIIQYLETHIELLPPRC